MKRLLITGLFFFALCQREQPSVVVIEPKVESRFTGKLIECGESDAEMVLELFVTVQDEGIKRYPFTIPLRTGRDGDWTQQSGGYFCAVGPEGGFSGALRVIPADGDVVPVNLLLSYSSSTGQEKIDQAVLTTPGVDASTVIDDVGHVDWRWRAPRAVTPSPTPIK